jgi:hypothetical protein
MMIVERGQKGVKLGEMCPLSAIMSVSNLKIPKTHPENP